MKPYPSHVTRTVRPVTLIALPGLPGAAAFGQHAAAAKLEATADGAAHDLKAAVEKMQPVVER